MAAYSTSHTEPNIHPGGVHGAFSAAAYQAPFILIGSEPSTETVHDAARKPRRAAICRRHGRVPGAGVPGALCSTFKSTDSL